MAGHLGRDIALTGIPRGGTTLACHLLNGCPRTVALFEPMDVAGLPVADRAAALGCVARFYGDVRNSLIRDGTAPSKQRDGIIPDNPFTAADASGLRRLQTSPGKVHWPAPLTPGFDLAIKHNAAFAALLPELAQAYLTFAIVRNPLAVLASWNSVALPVGEGRLPVGERLDPVLARELARIPDHTRRQLRILEWFFSRFASALPADAILRYEDVVATHGAVLFARAGLQDPVAPSPPLSDRNADARRPASEVLRWRDALLVEGGTWMRWYTPDSVRRLAQRLLDHAEPTA